MKNILSKFLTTALFLSIAFSVGQISFASEVLGTLSSGPNPTPEQNNLASLADSSTINSAVSNLMGTGNNSATMIEGMIIGALLTFFVCLFIFMITLFIRRNRRKNINVM